MEDQNAKNRRKRGLGMVTPNACLECRKKRSKCDGKNPCSRCIAQDVNCVYEVPIRQSKEMMRSEIEELQKHRRHSERVLKAISANQHEEIQFIIERLKNGVDIVEISEKLDEVEPFKGPAAWKNTTSYPNIATADHKAIEYVLQAAQQLRNVPPMSLNQGVSQLQSALPTVGMSSGSQWPPESVQFGTATPMLPESMAWMPTESPDSSPEKIPDASFPLVASWRPKEDLSDSMIQRARGQGQDYLFGKIASSETGSESVRNPRSWTTVTDDLNFINHLLALYFCWEYPTFASFSKEHFLEDFQAGRERYCSPLLVNAVLSLGCRFSSQAEARAIPDDPTSSGDQFFEEARRLLHQEKRVSLLTIQALGLMAIREGSYGRDANSIFYSQQSIRLAVEMGLHANASIPTNQTEDWDSDMVVQSATFWGALSLDQAWSLTVGRIPHVTPYVPLIAKPPILSDVEGSEWIPYTDDGMPLSRHCEQPSNVRSVFKCFCELSEIIQSSLYLLYAPGSRFNNQELLSVYARYLGWYDNLPVVLRLGHNFTPSVLFVHMYYHTAILLLFRPFIKLRMVGSGISPQVICSQCADTIAGLVHSFKQLYTLRRTPCFLPYLVLTGSITHLTLAKETGNIQPVLSAASVLKELTACHGFAYRALRILNHMIKSWNLPIDIDNLIREADLEHKSPTKLDDAGLLASSTSVFCPDMDLLRKSFEKVTLDGEDAMFSVFPLQGVPQFPKVPDPARDGFIFDPKGKSAGSK